MKSAPNGLLIDPQLEELWDVVNERDDDHRQDERATGVHVSAGGQCCNHYLWQF
jgi:hypothetical protein